MRGLSFGLALVLALTSSAAIPANGSSMERALSCRLSWDEADRLLSGLRRTDQAPPKLEGLEALKHPEIQRLDEWQGLGTNEDGAFFKDLDPGANSLFGLKIKTVITKRGSPITRTDPERILRIVFDANYARVRQSALAALGQESCAKELSEDGEQACFLQKPAGAPADLDQLGVAVNSAGLVTYECLFIDTEAQKRRDALLDALK